MYNTELKKIMKKKNISKESLSHMMGINYDELNKKLSGDIEFTLWEIKCISEIFSLNRRQIMNIFFNNKFPKGNKGQDRAVNDE